MDMLESAPFSDLLKAFRQQKRISQRDLAVKLGVHYNTISKWERGMCLPDSKGMVLELAKELHLDEHESRVLLEASLTALSPYWSVPYPRNPFFTGREEILEALHAHLGVDQATALTQLYALHGLGGVGKTQIALEYAYRYALEYSAVFWLGAETIESITSGMLAIARALQLPGRDDQDQERVVAAVRHWLSGHRQWLMIWDNLEDLNLLQRFLPTTRQGVVLLTTRQQALGIFARGINLPPMKQEEGTLFLLRRAKLLEPEVTGEQIEPGAHMPAEYAAASELVTVMGGLPLALDQAGAYIEETGCSLALYLQLYEQQRARLLDRRGLLGGDHPHSVATTFRLASERIEEVQQAAALLKVCAFLHAEAIPEELFVAGAAHLGPELAPLTTDSSQFDQAIVVLRSLSLVQRQAETRTLSLHRLVQTVLRERMSEQEQTLWLKRVLKALNALFPEVIHEVWKQCERLLPHALAVIAALPDRDADPVLVAVLRKTATYLRGRAQHTQAEPLYQRALRIGEEMLGPAHRDVVFSLNGLGLLYTEQGKYEQAELLYQRALRIGEEMLGPTHRDVALSLNGLALLYTEQGKYEQAELLYRRALRIREAALGAGHPETTELLVGLALLYIEQEKNEQAMLLCQQTLQIWEGVVEADHPGLTSTLCELAGQESEKRALALWEQVGTQYPHVSFPLYGLATLYAREGKDELAASFYRCTLHIGEQAVGSEYPDMAYPLNGLANLYLRQGKYEQAEPLFQRALQIREFHFGPHHQETAQTLQDLAIFYFAQGHINKALSLAERALKIYTQTLKDAHPRTVATSALCAQLLQEQQKEAVLPSAQKRQDHFRKQGIPQKRAVVSRKIAPVSPGAP